jgi:glycosyltransferase involved in cell wall biosynthesis
MGCFQPLIVRVMNRYPKLQVALLTNMIAPYRVSFYNALAGLCDLVVVTDAETEFNRSWNMDKADFRFLHVVMHSRSIVLPRVRKDLGYREHRQLHFSEKVIAHLDEISPDIVISNELGLRSLWCMMYAKWRDKPWILASEATNHTEGWVGPAKRALRHFLISQADYFWSNGRETQQFLCKRGADSGRIMNDMTGIATSDFHSESAKWLQQRDALRRGLGLNGVVFLFAGRLESGKGIAQLMEAIESVDRQLAGRCSFLFVGGGSLLPVARERAAKIADIPFHFEGFVQPEELPKLFSLGDIFLMPTLDDNWPLVNLEALAAGLPQLYSIYNGGMQDMNALAGVGAAIDPRDIRVLAQRLVDCVTVNPCRLSGGEVHRLLNHYSPESQAERAMRSFVEAQRLHADV